MKRYLSLLLALFLLVPISMVFSQGPQGNGLGVRPLSKIEGILITELVECDCTDCDHGHEEEANVQYYLSSLGTLYQLHLGPKWWRVDHLNLDLIKEGEEVEATGWLKDEDRQVFFVSTLKFPYASFTIRDESGPPPWGGQKVMKDEWWQKQGDFH